LGKRWRGVRTLIVDEIRLEPPDICEPNSPLCVLNPLPPYSMLNSATFAFAEEFARGIRNSVKPFGGIQVVTCGDFFQLPPVARDGAVSFAFEAEAWNVVFGPQHTIELKQVCARVTCAAFVSRDK